MTIHLYGDEDAMDQDLVRSLRARGVNVTTALEEDMIVCGAADASPAEMVSFGRRSGPGRRSSLGHNCDHHRADCCCHGLCLPPQSG